MTEEKQAKRRFSRGQVTILVALVIVTLGVYGALMVAFARQKRAPTAITVGSAGSEKLELHVAHQEAQAWAVGWQADAQLVSVVTRWQLAGGDRLTLHRPSWSFSFYSPAVGRVQTVTVDRAGVQAVRQVPVNRAPVPVDADWSLGSDELLTTFMAYGGDDFIREHSRVNLHFRLSGQEAERPTWYLSAIDPEARQSFVVGVDALSRQVVLTS